METVLEEFLPIFDGVGKREELNEWIFDDVAFAI